LEVLVSQSPTIWHCAIRTDADEPGWVVRLYSEKLADQQPLLYRNCVVVLCDSAAEAEAICRQVEAAC
jgi:hypothetical protein